MTQARPRGVPRWAVLVLGVVGLLGTVVLMAWSLQRSLVYFPDTSTPPPASEVVAGARDVTLRTGDGLDLGAWLVPPAPGTDRGLAVLYAPGNGGNRWGRADLAAALGERGFTVLLLDYRGYGGNPGSPSEDGLAADADAAANLLEAEGFPADRTVYLGESLGTGVVARLAEDRPPRAVLLRSPFTNLADVGSHHYPWAPVSLVLRDRFEVLERIERSPVPLTVVRAEHDSVVPSELSARVAAAAPHLVEEVVLPHTDHNDPAMFGDPVAEALVRLVESG